jgi:hypothetical protein
MSDDDLMKRLDNLWKMLEDEGYYTKANTVMLAKQRIEELETNTKDFDILHREYEKILTDCIKELEAKLAKAVEHIEWFISEDETNRGDEPMSSHGGRTWDEINEYFITHLDSAVAFVTELKGETDE